MDPSEQGPLWLLLLPCTSSPVTLASLRSAYGQTIFKLLREASHVTELTSSVPTIDIALTLTDSLGCESRSKQYQSLQNLVCQLYRLVCLFCTEQNIDIENGNEVDIRFIILEAIATSSSIYGEETSNGSSTPCSILSPNIELLALCSRKWKHISTLEGEAGTAIIHKFLRIRNSPTLTDPRLPTLGDIPANLATPSFTHGLQDETKVEMTKSSQHYSVAVGGTFDHLHAGHKLLLTMTALILAPCDLTQPAKKRNLTVGITGDELLKRKKYPEELQDWDERQESVRNFLSAFLLLDSPDLALLSTDRTTDLENGARVVRDQFQAGLAIHYVEIFDPFGPTITDEDISALVVSGETRSGGKAVNDRRSEKRWAALEVFEVDVLNAVEDGSARGQVALEQQFEDKISSTAIRQKLNLRHRDGP